MCIYIYVCVYVYIYIYMCVCIYTYNTPKKKTTILFRHRETSRTSIPISTMVTINKMLHDAMNAG